VNALLEVRNLRSEFVQHGTKIRAVSDVTFSVNKGKTLAIVGESGSGKSVTAMTVMGLTTATQQTSGEVLLDGRDLLKLAPKDMRKVQGKSISMIFQDPMTSLNPLLTVGSQIIEGLRKHEGLSRGNARERAAQLLDLVGIPSARSRLKCYPHEFSGGQRQRVMIAMALSCNPDLLLADEPTTALDVTIQAQILDLIRKLQRDLNTAVVLITHDLGVVAGFADDVVVMYAGYVVETAPVDTIFENPRMPYTMGLLRSVPSLADDSPRLFPVRGRPPDPTVPLAGCPFSARCDHSVAGVCDSTMPALRTVGPDHFVRCHFDVILKRSEHGTMTRPEDEIVIGRATGEETNAATA
jgi:oligopeptide transport system ATP-binding protein